ncbi:MAG: secondary thiamine-phosphate synthase enzyme YjbQ [bacterium]
MVKTEKLTFQMRGNSEIRDITGDVSDRLEKSGLKNGLVTVFVPGATGAVTTIENESGLVKDFRELMEKWIPSEKEYHHNLRWGDGNGHSHLRASIVGPSLAVPVVDGRMTLGTWQQIVLIDFDVRPRSRGIIVQMTGE